MASVFKIANEIAHDFDLEFVGTEHVLLAIQREGTGVGAAVLTQRGITNGKLIQEVENLVKKQLEETWVFGRLPGSPHYRNVMATAIEQCRQLEASEVRTEHILLALLKEKGSVAQKALQALGLSYQDAKADVLALTSA
ncbi:MAG: Clp protease N-terminal domain-containing protein [Phycisphaerae bacterium]